MTKLIGYALVSTHGDKTPNSKEMPSKRLAAAGSSKTKYLAAPPPAQDSPQHWAGFED